MCGNGSSPLLSPWTWIHSYIGAGSGGLYHRDDNPVKSVKVSLCIPWGNQEYYVLALEQSLGCWNFDVKKLQTSANIMEFSLFCIKASI